MIGCISSRVAGKSMRSLFYIKILGTEVPEDVEMVVIGFDFLFFIKCSYSRKHKFSRRNHHSFFD